MGEDEPNDESTATLAIFPEDSGRNGLLDTVIVVESLDDGRTWPVERGDEPGQLIVSGLPPGRYRVTATPSSDGLESVTRELELEPGYRGITVVLGAPDQRYFLADGMKVYFDGDDQAFLLVTYGDDAEKRSAETVAARNLQYDVLPSFRVSSGPIELRENQRTPDIGFIQVHLPNNSTVDGSGELILTLTNELSDQNLRTTPGLVVRRGDRPIQCLSNEFVIHFRADVAESRARSIAGEYGFSVVRFLPHAGNSYLVAQPGPPTYRMLDFANQLNELPEVEAAEPNLINQMETHQFVPNDPLWTNLDHLTHTRCDHAWERLGTFRGNPALAGGDPGIAIAVFDPAGVSVGQPDLLEPLSDTRPKLVQSYNFVHMMPQDDGLLGSMDSGTGVSMRDHGTECAGVATAAFDNGKGVAGVAPNCHLIGARLPSLGDEATLSAALTWAAGLPTGYESFPEAPEPRAAVISNSWGYDGVEMSTLMRRTFDNLVTNGRGGLGTIVVFSTGNIGHCPFGRRFTYAASSRTVAVGASTNVSPTAPFDSAYADQFGETEGLSLVADRRALYSPYGYELDVVAPSNTTFQLGTGLHIDPICTTVRIGRGNLDGCTTALECKDYAEAFGGTSAAAPMVAGAAALVLSVNSEIPWRDVHRILRDSAIHIDFHNTDAIGAWTHVYSDGIKDFSRWYGFGRLDVAAAVAAAIAYPGS